MRKTMLVVASAALAMVVLGGVAWAATIRCPDYRPDNVECNGTPGDDTLYGTSNANVMYGWDGRDTMYGYNRMDWIQGGKGKDKVFGGRGDDGGLSGGVLGNGFYPDASDDYVHGGRDSDIIIALAQGGVDRLYGERGNDFFSASQREYIRRGITEIAVTKEIVDCGPGSSDYVDFDKGVDVVKDNCEIKRGWKP
jgi:hypothetical protein